MNFILGIIIGLAIGGLLVHLAHEYFDAMLSKDERKHGIGGGE
jgi:hypothetical protein